MEALIAIIIGIAFLCGFLLLVYGNSEASTAQHQESQKQPTQHVPSYDTYAAATKAKLRPDHRQESYTFSRRNNDYGYRPAIEVDNSKILQPDKGDSGYPEIDLHGLLVQEALKETGHFILQNQQKSSRVIIITGRGQHSPDGEAKIKPAVIQLLKDCGFKYSERCDGGALEVSTNQKRGFLREGDFIYPEVNLCGLFVEEALQKASYFLLQNQLKASRLVIITGRGLLSPNGVPKIKPAVMQLLNNCGFDYSEVNKGGALEVITKRKYK